MLPLRFGLPKSSAAIGVLHGSLMGSMLCVHEDAVCLISRAVLAATLILVYALATVVVDGHPQVSQTILHAP